MLDRDLVAALAIGCCGIGLQADVWPRVTSELVCSLDPIHDLAVVVFIPHDGLVDEWPHLALAEDRDPSVCVGGLTLDEA